MTSIVYELFPLIQIWIYFWQTRQVIFNNIFSPIINNNSWENINDIVRMKLKKTLHELHQSPFSHRMPISTFHSTNYREQEWKINKIIKKKDHSFVDVNWKLLFIRIYSYRLFQRLTCLTRVTSVFSCLPNSIRYLPFKCLLKGERHRIIDIGTQNVMWISLKMVDLF